MSRDDVFAQLEDLKAAKREAARTQRLAENAMEIQYHLQDVACRAGQRYRELQQAFQNSLADEVAE